MSSAVREAAFKAGLLSPEQLADYLGVPLATIYQWRHQGTGPVVLKVGRHLRYRPGDVEAWLEDCASKGAA